MALRGESDPVVCGQCGLPWGPGTPMPEVCLRCYVLQAKDMKDFKTKIRIVEYLFARDGSDDE